MKPVARPSSVAASVLFPTSFVSPEKFLMLALALAEKCCPQVIIGRFAVLAPSTRIKNNAVIILEVMDEGEVILEHCPTKRYVPWCYETSTEM